MNEIENALQRHEQRKNYKERKKETPKISKEFSKILLSIILLLSVTIYVKLSPNHLQKVKESVFENNLAFTKINDWYHNTFGTILPSVVEPNSAYVDGSSLNEKTPFLDGYKIKTSQNAAVTNLSSGLLVFMGEKEGYGNTLILQGVDGVDIWYGEIENTSLKLYDYVDAGTIIGTAKKDYYNLVFQKDGEFLTYEEYFDQVSS